MHLSPFRTALLLITSSTTVPALADDAEQVSAKDLLPLRRETQTFLISKGEGAGQQIDVKVEPTKADSDAVWVLSLEDRNRVHLRKDAEGGIVVERLELPSKDKAIEYRPAVPLLPATITAQLRQSVGSEATVYSLSDGQPLYSGPVTHEIERVTRATFNTPIGSIRGYLVQLSHTIDLAAADVTMDMDIGFASDGGLVYRHMKTHIEKLGLFGDTTQRTIEIAEAPAAAR